MLSKSPAREKSWNREKKWQTLCATFLSLHYLCFQLFQFLLFSDQFVLVLYELTFWINFLSIFNLLPPPTYYFAFCFEGFYYWWCFCYNIRYNIKKFYLFFMARQRAIFFGRFTFQLWTLTHLPILVYVFDRQIEINLKQSI